MTLSQLLYAYTCIPEVGPASLRRIMDSFVNPDEAWTASSNQLLAIGLKQQVVVAINEKRPTINALATWQELMNDGVNVVTIRDEAYPTLLREIPAPPPLLMYRGTLPTKTCVAVVGTRRCTPYGIAVAEQLGRDLTAADITVVSGLAYGIDAAAHRGALTGGGRTVAIVGTGLNWRGMYPAEHRPLAEQILSTCGCLVSEHGLHAPAHPGHFPRRNRIVSGLCRAVVVVEAGERSGALLTAHLALEQNREVMAVPGPITSPISIGTNRMLRRGATPCTCAADILEAIGLVTANSSPATVPMAPAPLPADLSAIAEQVYRALSAHELIAADILGESLGLAAADLAMAITELELAGLIKREGSSIMQII
jgi:DNA processing protein